MPDDLPPWFQELRARYLAGDGSVFVVEAPVGAQVAAPGGAAPLPEAVVACLGPSRDQVFTYDILQGLRGLSPAARARRPELPADHLTALQRLIGDARGSAAVLLPHADLTLPSGPGATDAQRQAELLLRQALDSQRLRSSDHVVILTVPAGARLPPALAAHPRWIRIPAAAEAPAQHPAPPPLPDDPPRADRPAPEEI